jgi:2,3-diketo-5-methylthio-1-phosphopentane phosphatase
MRKIAILCDFDGTIAVEDVGSLLFRTFSERPTDDLIKRWKNGEISSRECIEREAEVTSVSNEALNQFIHQRRLDPYFKDFIDFAKKRGMDVVIVSDGLDYYIEKMLVRNGLAELDFYANLLDHNNGNFKVMFPYYNVRDCRDCGNCKTHHLEKYKAAGFYVIYVGNGLSDRCPSEYADLVFAKGELLDFCKEKCIKHIAFKNFRDVEREVLQRFVLREEFQDEDDLG